ncbi:nicotinate-nucleotide--dimethylbenzimidazole phosphoribosyltransferase [Chelativorans salis]|uniref:Nicotinate-nucleotide--dimethylbenzimidazole phosphoribosyltransferase n=1 Tax=Chelativorans salis TaxID=2978478 RepID=A0ABT2LLY5_9HYPH|nr:nicotinate-nucleotide--dimethylbenzimidazole phosphoribosyltransferase [Chelativorans sp. EGI FJ00035]MCT7375533.1 nicotinate-nucleotide--dimethylbenzimidazole phosphoribosyltransferase [Chelativorans sp. EGI FJ00035]
MTTSGLPFDDIRNLASQLPGLNEAAAGYVRGHLSGEGGERALGRLETLAAWLAAVTGRAPARVARPAVALFAASHGIARHLGTGDPVAEARGRVEAIASGAAPVSHLCAAGDLGLNVFDLALDLPVGDITEAPALDERAAAATMAFGMEAVALGADLLCLGAVGGAADLSAMAVLSALQKGGAEEWTEAGEEAAVLLGKALRTHEGHLGDPLEVVRRLGGREIAALAGAILAARTQKVAVILDGLAATAAAAVLHTLNPTALDHCLLADTRSEQHRKAAERSGLRPLLDLGTNGHDGIGAVLAAGLVKAAGELGAGMAEVKARTG